MEAVRQRKNDRNTLQRTSRDFRMVASRLLTTHFREGKRNLRRFIDHIDTEPILHDFIRSCLSQEYDMELVFKEKDRSGIYPIPTDPAEEIGFTYQLLKHAADREMEYFMLAWRYGDGNFHDHVREFNKSVVKPFVNHIVGHLTGLLMDLDSANGARYSVRIDSADQVNLAAEGGNVSAHYIRGDASGQRVLELAEKVTEELDSLIPQSDHWVQLKEIAEFAKEQVVSDRPKVTLLRASMQQLITMAATVQAGEVIGNTINKFAEALRSWLQTLG